MSFTYQPFPFISRLYKQSNLLPYSNDEYELNINFWEAKAYKQWCIYDPYFTIADISSSDNIFTYYIKSYFTETKTDQM